MAASTLHTLLIKLGFDTAGLSSGGRVARTEMQAVGAAAQNLATAAAPAAAALNNIGMAGRAATSSLVTARQAATMAATATGPLVTAQQAAAQAMKASYAAAGPLITSLQGVGAAGGAAAGGLVTARQAATTLASATGPLVTSQVAAAQALRATYVAAGPLVAGVRGAHGAFAAAAPAANLAAAGFQMAGNAAGGAVPPIRNVAGAANAAAGGFNAIPPAAGRAAGSMHQIAAAADVAANRASFLNRTLSMAFAFSGGVAITTLIGFIGNALIGFNSRLEQAQIAFTTLLGDSSKASAFIEQMKDFAEVTPFEFPGLQDAVQHLMAMGFAAEDALPTLRIIGDTTAALGGNQEKLNRIAVAFGQMSTAGRVNAQDMRQLTEAGIPAWAMLADAIGKTVQETRDLTEKGLIPAGQAISILLSGMNERFGGMMAEQARTAQGAFSTIKDAALQTMSGAVEPLFNLMSQVMVNIADFFINGGGAYIVPVIQAIGVAIAVFLIPRLIGLITTMEMATIAIGSMAIPILPLIIAVSAFGLAWQENFGGIQTTFGPIIGQLVDFAGAILDVVASSGLLIPILEILVTLITVKFVWGLAAAGAGMIFDALAAVALAGAFTGLAVSAGTATTAISPLAAIVAALGGIVFLVVAVVAAAAILLVLNFEQVGQGVRVLAYYFVGAIKTIVDAAASLPFVGDQFKGLSEGLQDTMDGLVRGMAESQAKIDAAKAASGGADVNPLGDIDKWLEEFKKRIGGGTTGIVGETQTLVEQFGTTLDGVREAAKSAGGGAMEEMATEIRAHQNAPLDALKTLHDMVRNQLDPTVEIARLYGMLISEDLAAGMASGDSAVYAQAVATKKLIEERLNELTDGAYAAGAAAAEALTQGFQQVIDANPHFGPDGKELYGPFLTTAQQAASGWNKVKPSVEAVEDAMKGVNAELNKAAYSSGLSALNSAFNDIKQSAHRYFEEVHQGNLKAISDALKHKNALLDAKAAMNQAPVTAAQKALDFQRQQIEEWRLREAVSKASSPEEYRDAVLALQDFLAQKHIDEMQAQVDAANAAIDLQKEANERRAEAQREAENERYERQVESFDRQLELLRAYLEKHPGEWQNTNEKVLELLKGYGISYKTAGARLGSYFAEGLREQVAAAVAAAKEMADLIPEMFDVNTGGAGLPPTGGLPPGWHMPYGSFADGNWQVMNDNLLGLLHKDEMVAPAESASLLRALGSKKLSGAGVSSGGPSTGGGTLVVQIGEEIVADIVDRSLAVSDDIYGGRRRISTGSQR